MTCGHHIQYSQHRAYCNGKCIRPANHQLTIHICTCIDAARLCPVCRHDRIVTHGDGSWNCRKCPAKGQKVKA